MTTRQLRVLTYHPPRRDHEKTIAAWVVRAVLNAPAEVDAGRTAAALGIAPHHVQMIRDRSARP